MRAEPDGYTLGAISDSPMTVNPSMYEKLAYQPAAGFRRGGADQSLPVLSGREPRNRHQDRRRPDQGRQGKARHAELFVRRRRQFQPSRPRRGGLQDRHQHRPCALSRRRPCDDGRARWRRAAHVQQRRNRPAACAGRQAQRPRGRRHGSGCRPFPTFRPSPKPSRASTSRRGSACSRRPRRRRTSWPGSARRSTHCSRTPRSSRSSTPT